VRDSGTDKLTGNSRLQDPIAVQKSGYAMFATKEGAEDGAVEQLPRLRCTGLPGVL
jgi:hypothetical protein